MSEGEGGHFDTGAMAGMKQGAEVPVGVHLEPIEDGDALHKYQSAIQRMRFNALDTSKNYGLQTARRDEVRTLFHEYLAPGRHGALFVAKDGDRIAGFVAATLSPDKRSAVIDDIWLDEKNHQHELLAEVLDSTENYLRERNVQHAFLHAPHESRELHMMREHFEPLRFYSVEDGKDEGEERHHMEKAA